VLLFFVIIIRFNFDTAKIGVLYGIKKFYGVYQRDLKFACISRAFQTDKYCEQGRCDSVPVMFLFVVFGFMNGARRDGTPRFIFADIYGRSDK